MDTSENPIERPWRIYTDALCNMIIRPTRLPHVLATIVADYAMGDGDPVLVATLDEIMIESKYAGWMASTVDGEYEFIRFFDRGNGVMRIVIGQSVDCLTLPTGLLANTIRHRRVLEACEYRNEKWQLLDATYVALLRQLECRVAEAMVQTLRNFGISACGRSYSCPWSVFRINQRLSRRACGDDIMVLNVGDEILPRTVGINRSLYPVWLSRPDPRACALMRKKYSLSVDNAVIINLKGRGRARLLYVWPNVV
jgi:hypothetical protein